MPAISIKRVGHSGRAIGLWLPVHLIDMNAKGEFIECKDLGRDGGRGWEHETHVAPELLLDLIEYQHIVEGVVKGAVFFVVVPLGSKSSVEEILLETALLAYTIEYLAMNSVQNAWHSAEHRGLQYLNIID